MRLSPVRRAGLSASTPLLRRGDVDAMRRAGAIVANSVVTRDRIRAAYGLDSIVVHPPVEPVASEARSRARDLPDGFAVVVARDRGYKNVSLAVEAARGAGMPIVIVGSGSEGLDDPEHGVHGLGRVTDSELCWVYRNAAVVVGAGREDFGLTVLEAALEGTPAATVGRAGTSRPCGRASAASTRHPRPPRPGAAIREARELDGDACREWGHGFRRDAHVARLATVLDEVGKQAWTNPR